MSKNILIQGHQMLWWKKHLEENYFWCKTREIKKQKNLYYTINFFFFQVENLTLLRQFWAVSTTYFMFIYVTHNRNNDSHLALKFPIPSQGNLRSSTKEAVWSGVDEVQNKTRLFLITKKTIAWRKQKSINQTACCVPACRRQTMYLW